MNKPFSIAVLLLSLLLGSQAQGAGQRPADMTASPAIVGTQITWCPVGTANDYKCTFTQIDTFINAQFSGDFTCTSGGACTLKNTGPGATGPIGSTTTVPVVTIDAQGRVTGLTSATAAGTVSSVATSCGVSGGPITATGTISATTSVNPQAGTNYPFVSGDCGKVVNLSNASNQIPTIPSGTTLGSGWFTEACNQGAGTQTITPASGTIGGASTYVLAAGTAAAPKCVGIVSDGTNLQLDMTGVGGSGSSGANPTATGSDTAVNGSAGTFMRSDGAPAIQKGSNAQFGLAEGDNTSVSMTAGVVSTKAFTGDCTTSAGSVATACRQTTPVYIVNNWLEAGDEHNIAPTSNGTLNNQKILCYPDYFHGPATISALGARVNTTFAGGSYQLALYANNAATGRPTGTALVSSASLSTTASGAVSTTNTTVGGTISLSLTGTPLIWWCSNSDNSTSTLSGTISILMASYIGSATQANLSGGSTRSSGIQVSSITFGTWPDLTGATFLETPSSASFPTVQFKIGSVP